MLRIFKLVIGGGALLALGVVIGCSSSAPSVSSQKDAKRSSDDVAQDASSTPSDRRSTAREGNHGHQAGAHGGIIVSLGRDSYHVEAIVTKTGELRLYTLGQDESRVIAIEAQDLTAFVKAEGASDATSIEFKAQPQPGDDPGKASLFVASLPDSLAGQTIEVTVPNIMIGGERFRLGFTNRAATHDSESMPAKVADEAERQLYLSPGGLYTQADIEANGKQTGSQKFAGFEASHDLKPKVGDKLCPVTLTKANPKCSWIVGGKTYEFCCPPCVDEFVRLAKSKPDEVHGPEHYVKRETESASDGAADAK